MAIEETEPKEEARQVLPVGYPKHSASFETYFYLGETRTLRASAFIRFQQLVPDCPETNPAFATKFESFYKKIKRWAEKEDWRGWCVRKEFEERQKREEEGRVKLMSMDRTLKMYQTLVRQALVVWSDKIKASIELRKAIAEQNQTKMMELAAKEKVEIRSFQDAKLCMELDIYLSDKLEAFPELRSAGAEKLAEEEREKVDKVMEGIRKHASDVSAGKEDNGETNGRPEEK